jgi:hypothetical protein
MIAPISVPKLSFTMFSFLSNGRLDRQAAAAAGAGPSANHCILATHGANTLATVPKSRF